MDSNLFSSCYQPTFGLQLFHQGKLPDPLGCALAALAIIIITYCIDISTPRQDHCVFIPFFKRKKKKEKIFSPGIL